MSASISIFLDCPSLEKKARYVWQQFAAVAGFSVSIGCERPEDAPICIYYGQNQPPDDRFDLVFQVDATTISFFEKSTPISRENVSWFSWNGLKLPVFFRTRERDATPADLDPIASTFLLLSAWNEVLAAQNDVYGRASLADNILFQLDCHHLPVVDYYFQWLIWHIEQIANRKHIPLDASPRWPKSKQYALFLSHDVDAIDKGRWRRLPHEIRLFLTRLRHGDAGSGWRFFRGSWHEIIHDHNPYWGFDTLLAWQRQFSIPATYFFLAGGTTRFDRVHGYELTDPRLVSLFQQLHGAGQEIALHGSFNTMTDGALLKSEKDTLARASGYHPHGGRQHWLRWQADQTPALYAQLGLQYDASVGFSHAVGFRSGTCYPYLLYDCAQDAPTSVLELPLLVMDRALIDYLRWTPDEALNRIQALVSHVRQVGGVFSLLWHNMCLGEHEFPGWSDVLGRLLQFLDRQPVWVAPGQRLAAHWRKRLQHFSD